MPVTHADVVAAEARIAGRVHRTPLIASATIDGLAGLAIRFKCENMQRSGSFKFRGATNAVLALSPEQRAAGVATHSSGNHGSALAAVARDLGVRATIVVPRGASAFKREAIARYGAEIVDCGDTLDAREAALAEVIERTGAVFVPPYDDPEIIAGQGTIGLEVLRDCSDADELWLPVGGGGLAAGNVVSAGESLQVVGAEPELARDAYDSLETGERQRAMAPVTCADGLRTALGELNFAILERYGLPIKLVTEDEIVAAQKLAMSCLKVLVETSAAVPLAALMRYGPHHPASRSVVIVLSGGNLAFEV